MLTELTTISKINKFKNNPGDVLDYEMFSVEVDSYIK